jgi:hypothetical protein
VNTSVTTINLEDRDIEMNDEEEHRFDGASALVDEVIARNNRLRRLFIFDARKMLLSLMRGCADECNSVFPYFLDGDDLDIMAAGDVEPLRAEFAVVVEERFHRAAAAAVQLAATDNEEGGSPAVKWRRTNQ